MTVSARWCIAEALVEQVMGGRLANPFRLLADRVCRRLWLSGVAINIMRWLEMLAFSLYALETTGSPFMVALTGFARIVPLLFSGFSSAWTEGLDRRHVVCGIMATLLFVDSAMLVVALMDALSMPLLLIASFIAGCAWMFENPLRRTMLAEVAGVERVSESMGLETASNQGTRALGPAVGGLLVATVDLVGVFVIGILLHGFALAAVSRLPASLASSDARKLSITSVFRDGLAYVRRHRLVQGALVITVIFNMWCFPYVSLAPVIGETVLDLSPVGIGLLLGTEGLGGLVGAFLIVLAARPRWYATIYTLGALLFAVGVTSLAYWQVAWPAFLCLFAAGMGMAGFNGMQVTIPLLASPVSKRVRILGLITVCIGAGPIGMLYAGWLAEWLGAPMAQLLMGAQGIVLILLAIWRWPELLKVAEPKPVAETPRP